MRDAHREHLWSGIALAVVVSTCDRDGGGNCITHLPPGGGWADYWASEVDYWTGWEFRVGRGGVGGLGESWELMSGSTSYFKEPGDVRPPRPDPRMTHSYVRAPATGRTALLFHEEIGTSLIGQLRYTFVDEPTHTPADQ